MIEVREIVTDVATGETTERMVVMPDVLTVEQAQAADLAALADTQRGERDRLLAAADWSMLPDAPLNGDQRSAWVVYRQALRDVTEQPGFPTDITWPTPP